MTQASVSVTAWALARAGALQPDMLRVEPKPLDDGNDVLSVAGAVDMLSAPRLEDARDAELHIAGSGGSRLFDFLFLLFDRGLGGPACEMGNPNR